MRAYSDALFQPTLPARGATTASSMRAARWAHFNPRSPHGERQTSILKTSSRDFISTHAPRTGSDGSGGAAGTESEKISTHAPRTGSDVTDITFVQNRVVFQPTLPARGATRIVRRIFDLRTNFNPRSPHGERPVAVIGSSCTGRFQPTLPARGATRAAPCALLGCFDFNPRSPHGERHVLLHEDLRHVANFNPRSPHGERPPNIQTCAVSVEFQPTLPARGATTRVHCVSRATPISTHAPRTGSDLTMFGGRQSSL